MDFLGFLRMIYVYESRLLKNYTWQFDLNVFVFEKKREKHLRIISVLAGKNETQSEILPPY